MHKHNSGACLTRLAKARTGGKSTNWHGVRSHVEVVARADHKVWFRSAGCHGTRHLALIQVPLAAPVPDLHRTRFLGHTREADRGATRCAVEHSAHHQKLGAEFGRGAAVRVQRQGQQRAQGQQGRHDHRAQAQRHPCETCATPYSFTHLSRPSPVGRARRPEPPAPAGPERGDCAAHHAGARGARARRRSHALLGRAPPALPGRARRSPAHCGSHRSASWARPWCRRPARRHALRPCVYAAHNPGLRWPGPQSPQDLGHALCISLLSVSLFTLLARLRCL